MCLMYSASAWQFKLTGHALPPGCDRSPGCGTHQRHDTEEGLRLSSHDTEEVLVPIHESHAL
jgi:hypothetical protein